MRDSISDFVTAYWPVIVQFAMLLGTWIGERRAAAWSDLAKKSAIIAAEYNDLIHELVDKVYEDCDSENVGHQSSCPHCGKPVPLSTLRLAAVSENKP